MSVKLSLVVGDYVQNANKAANATRSIADAAGQLGPAQQAMQGLQRVGADLGATLGAIGAVGLGTLAGMTTQAISAGVAYNSLQQTAGSALETLLGSAEAATAQMEELAAFARTSPFPRQMWIEAQQTLIGFGVEAEKVIPTFQSLQDGVVAVGGSAQSIQEVVLILAKLSSTGKITGEDLNQLAERGIDAATLVGEAWGLTAADIRESISAGTVDAGEFMDTLVSQMGTKYAGAAEGLRETWVGATDRIKGAMRDVGSAIAEPFIDPDGGGAAVQWANDAADALRAFESVLRPAIAVLSEKAEPAFVRASEAMQRFSDVIADIDIVAILDSLSAGAPVLTAFGAAAAAAGSASALSAIGMGGLAASINPVAAGVLGLAAASPVFRDALMDLLSAVAPLIPQLAALAVQIGEGLTLAINSLMPFVEVAIGLVGGMVSMFSALPAPIQQAALAVGAFALALKKLGPVGIVLTGIGFIATAVSSLAGESEEASVDVNTLAEDLKNLQILGRTFKIQEADFSGITGPLREAMDLIELSSERGGWADLTETGKEYVEVLDGAVWVTREMADEQGNLSNLVRQGSGDAEAFTSAVDTLDKALAQLVVEGMDSSEALLLVGRATGLSQDELALILPLMDEYAAEAEKQGAANEQAASAQEEFTAKVGASVAALQELADELRAQVDPVFAAVRAMQAYEDAQTAYNEAVDEHGASSEEAIEAEMALVEAYLAAAAAAGEMAKATGGDLPPELLHAAEAAGLGAEAIALLEEQFFATRDAGQQMGNDLANVNADLTTDTGRMAAQNGLELAGMEADYAAFVLASKASVDALMASGMSYSEAIAFVAANSNRSTSEIEGGFEDAREAGLEFSDEYPAKVTLSGDQAVIDRAKAVKRWLEGLQRTVTISFNYTSNGDWRDFLPRGGASVPYSTGGPVGGPLGAGDVVPAVLTPGEHVWTRAEVDAAGGHDAIEAMRSAVLAGQTRFAQSGSVGMSHSAPSTRAGITVNNLNIEAVNERFDLRQVTNELEWAGAV
jgi:tape measure domain-containing protein